MKNNWIKKNVTIILSFITIALMIVFIMMKSRFLPTGSPDVILSSGTVSAGDTIFQVIKDAGITSPEASNVTTALNKKFNVRDARTGHVYEIFHSSFGTVFGFKYWTKLVEYYEVMKSTQGVMTAEKYVIPSQMQIVAASGIIKENLWNAMMDAGFSPEMVMNFTDIFAWQVDFLTETRAGDRFKVAYEQYRYKNNVVKNGQILAAEYDGGFSSKYRAVFFRSADGKISSFYAPDGSSLLKLFLRAPLNFRRISSFFTKKRFHPILRYFRPHLGIDYSARAGTPVVSIGNGTVVFTGWNGGFGRQVIVKHNSTYTTMYGHLLKFARGIRTGVHVKQNQVVGYVGSTGLSTGPHLDFRIRQSGKYVNFLKLKFPPAGNVPKKYAGEFAAARESAVALLEGNGKAKLVSR